MNLAPKSRQNERVQNVRRAQQLLAAEPAGWMETLGARITEAEPGRVVLELVAGPQHRHGGGVGQGGGITQIADAALGMSLARLQEDGMWTPAIGRAVHTIKRGVVRAMSFDLKLSFITVAKVGETRRATGRVVPAGRRTAVTECRVEGLGGRLVATASGTFAMTREKE